MSPVILIRKILGKKANLLKSNKSIMKIPVISREEISSRKKISKTFSGEIGIFNGTSYESNRKPMGHDAVSVESCKADGNSVYIRTSDGGYISRILTHWVPTLLSVYPGVDITTPNWYPIPIPDDQFLEKRGTHMQIGTQHQILDYHFLENRATPQMYNSH